MTDKKVCWMCGGEANSREHRFKKTDLKRLFPLKNKDSSYSLEEFPISVSFAEDKGNGIKLIRSPNANNQKYPPLICAECNNSRTQSMDIKPMTNFRSGVGKILELHILI